MKRLAIALSGGGHRATLFALGVMQYLADAGLNPNVVSVASVSGGSLTNGVVAQRVDLNACDGADFEHRVTAPLLAQVACRGTLFAAAVTWLYLGLLTASAAATVLLPWCWDAAPGWRLAAFAAGVLITAWLAARRGAVCAQALRHTLFDAPGGATRMADLQRPVSHVLCSTDLRTGRAVYMSSPFVYGHGLGVAAPGTLALHRAVQASACFPGGFPPAQFDVRGMTFNDTATGAPARRQPGRLVLVDGGVYDNMADQWVRGLHARKQRWPALETLVSEPDTLVVVNAAARQEWAPFHARLPLWSEIAALVRDMNVLYENTTAVRRQDLVERFDEAQRSGQGLRGALVMIRQSPYDIAGYFAGDEVRTQWPERAARADAVLAALASEGREHWRELTRRSCKVPTTLRALGEAAGTELVRHGYVLAMANMHVILGAPLLDLPPPARFAALVAGER